MDVTFEENLAGNNLLPTPFIIVLIEAPNSKRGFFSEISMNAYAPCCFQMGIARKEGGCKGLSGWFGALFFHVWLLDRGGI